MHKNDDSMRNDSKEVRMSGIFQSLMMHAKEYKEIRSALAEGTTPLYLCGLGDTATAWLGQTLAEDIRKPILLIADSESAARRIHEDLQVLDEDWMFYPHREIEFFDSFADSHHISMERTRVLNALTHGEARGVVASVEALLRAVQPKRYRTQPIRIAYGENHSPEALVLKLLEMGYETVELVEAPGQLNLRGGILDVFSIRKDNPVRIEFFGDEVDSIRTFDPTDQVSIEKVSETIIEPCREWMITAENAEVLAERLEARAAVKGVPVAAADGLRETAEKLRARILSLPAIERYAALMWEKATLLDYFPTDSPVIWVDPVRIGDRAKAWYSDYEMRFSAHFENGTAISEQMELVYDFDAFRFTMEDTPIILSDLLKKDPRYFKPAEIIQMSQMDPPKYFGKLEPLKDDVEVWKSKGFKVILMLSGKERALRVRDALVEMGLGLTYHAALNGEVLSGQAVIVDQSFNEGLVFNSFKTILLSDKDIFGNENVRKGRKRSNKERVIRSFNELSEGDLVVHETHGIGRYLGLEQLKVDNHKKDYLKIKYSGDDYLYIPVEQMDFLQKYIGGAEDAAKLSKLGGIEWKKAKAKVRKAIEDMTDELVKLYAERQYQRGFGFSPDSEWQRQFEMAFPYEETPDQLKCIEEIKVDMEKAEPMERLLCGDVGYGKTEVAMRAIFKAVMDSKQAVILVPTTILAQQHYNNMSERFSKFPVKIDVMSRFKSKKQLDEVAQRVSDGLVDVLIGTHRVLSDDVRFKNLGLLVIDEEQRFGVKHKEKIKKLKTNIDVLTMTATPIPRTLHLSLSGIRDMSVIEDPPEDRYPIQTYVVDYNEGVICEAILRETQRNGQVYFVHNRIQDIDQVTARLQRMLPDLEIRYAHGQMNETQLEKVMMAFMAKEFDVLVSTTIIETGLDLPNVNTIIINDADKMGLSQLYQLRGRVGRSNRVAYSYLLYQKDKVLTEIAEKRLKAIKEFTDLGAGFRIAMRDLELRGTGNLLGSQQHGHMATVGYEMYCKMMEEAMRGVRGIQVEEPVETLIEFNIDAYIPDAYVPVQEHKLDLYRRISAVREERDTIRIEEEMVDRYGDLPEPVSNLIRVAYMKSLAQSLKITVLSEEDNAIVGRFRHDAPVTPESLLKLCDAYGKAFKFQHKPKPYFRLTFRDKNVSKEVKLNQTVIFLSQFLGSIHN